eukprot:7031280-Pyramimonas_sp.AAC.3
MPELFLPAAASPPEGGNAHFGRLQSACWQTLNRGTECRNHKPFRNASIQCELNPPTGQHHPGQHHPGRHCHTQDNGLDHETDLIGW